MNRSTVLLIIAAVFAFAGVLATREEPARAATNCSVTGSGLDGEETQFLSLLQQWRNSHPQQIPHSSPLEVSGALNDAAAWFAQWQVDHQTPGGHNDNLGRNWVQRAIDCGYSGTIGSTPAAYGSGEGVYGVSSSAVLNIGPEQAISGITYAGSGVYIDTPSTGYPARCVGVAVKRNAAGTSVAWVVVIAQYAAGQPCPAGSGGTAETTPTTSATATTPTKTPTPTPSPTPTPTPRTDGATITISAGWNLVIVPAGKIEDVLYRAAGCYRSVYQQEGDHWLRFAPEAPSWANNLRTSNGGVFWLEGTANCGRIPL